MEQVLIIKQPLLMPKRKWCCYVEHAFQVVLLYLPQHPTLWSSMMASSRKWREYTLSHLLNRYMSVIYLFLVFFVQSVFWGWSSAWGIFLNLLFVLAYTERWFWCREVSICWEKHGQENPESQKWKASGEWRT